MFWTNVNYIFKLGENISWDEHTDKDYLGSSLSNKCMTNFEQSITFLII